jgi:hypothetical protein
MADKPKSGGKGSKKYGRNKIKCANYRARKLREIHKVKRILQSNGRDEAIAYARAHGVKAPPTIGGKP